MKKLVQSLFVLLLIASSVLAQDRRITGKVTAAEDGLPLPGVSVKVIGTNQGTQTDANGNFAISVPANAKSLEISYIGFASQTLQIGTRSVFNVALANDAKQLSEVVVTGQGIGIEKKRLSTTVDKITSEEIASTPIVQLDQLLQAKLPSAQIRLGSGQPGTTSLIRSRGLVSANSSPTPVIYVDGVRVDNLNTQANLSYDSGGAQSSSIPDIPIENIESIEFIKGGAATTLYGADAANGVIQIFTKKGVAGKPEINFELQLGAVSGTKDYLKYNETADILFKTGLSQSYRLGLSGGSDKTTYSFSGNIYQNDGFRPNNAQKRYNFRTNLSSKLNDIVAYSGSFGFSANQFGRDDNANSSAGSFGNLETGAYGDLSEFTSFQIDSLKNRVISPIQRNVNNLETVRRFQTSQSFTITPMKDLTSKFTFGIDSRNSEQKQIATNAYLIALEFEAPGTVDQGYIDVYNRSFLGLTGDFNTQYKAELNDFSFISTVGAQVFRNIDKQNALHGTNVTEGSRSINNSASTTSEDYEQVLVNYGFYAAENIGYKNKLFAEFGLRFDGNSAFGKDVGLQSFPKVGLSYNISDESFFVNAIPSKVISQLKLRANYGQAGQFPTAFANDRTLTSNPFLGVPAYNLGQAGDPNLRPETTSTYEAGLDLGLLNGKMNISGTYYQTKTEDALFLAPFTPSYGLSNQLRNIGEISNKGWEFAASYHILSKKDFDLSFNASYNLLTESLVTSSGGAPEFSIGGFTFLGSFVKEGRAIGYLRGSKPTFASDGTLESFEANADLGSPIPKHFGSMGLNFSYKNKLNLSITGDYQMGAYGVNVDEVLRYFNGLQDDRIPEASLEESFFDIAGVWVEKTDYLKIRNISLSYNLPKQFTSNAFKNVEIGVIVLNPLNFYSSTFDPEITGSGANKQGGVSVGGFGFGTESLPRQFIGSLRVKF
ncbi:MAG TPA: TonB-dependent receptor [Pelobium sp.]|nr:TonB-dependent receptor [Pelobium sp.]